MTPRNESTLSSRPASPAPRRRFRLMKLEDRIAPKKGGNGTNNCQNDCGGSALFATRCDCGPY